MKAAAISSFLALLLSSLLVASAPLPSQEVVEEIVAKVNATIITKRELERRARLPMQSIFEQYTGEERAQRLKALQQQILEQAITEALLSSQAQRLGLSASESEIRAVLERMKKENNIISDEELNRQLEGMGTNISELRRDIRAGIVQRKVIEREVTSTIILTENDTVNYYNSHQEEFTQKAEVRIRQLLFLKEAKDEELVKMEALTTRQSINTTEDFIKVIRSYSGDPNADGDLGYFKQGELKKELEEVAFSLEVGQISEVIETTEGYYIIQLIDKKPPQRAPLEEVREEIQNSLWNERFQSGYQEYMELLRKANYVEILHPLK
ncbi:hypothetical protein CEE39_01580 [bacterium (candidate division B38) B3_B38]|nr:MAG: hypothetical protein CEE39_01580 [bacterium (candidate division B38) B3_B38]